MLIIVRSANAWVSVISFPSDTFTRLYNSIIRITSVIVNFSFQILFSIRVKNMFLYIRSIFDVLVSFKIFFKYPLTL